MTGGVPVWGTASASAYVGCSAYINSQTVANGATTYALGYTTNNFDTSSIHSTTVNNDRFTIPSGKSGKWLITAQLGLDNANGAVGYINFFTKKNGTDLGDYGKPLFANIGTLSSANNNTVLGMSAVLDLTVADYITFHVRTDQGNASSIRAQSTVTLTYLGA